MKKVLISILMFFAFMGANIGESTASYISYFYTSGDVIVFVPQAETNVSIKDTSGAVVWSFATILPGEIRMKTGLAEGHYRITSTKRVSLLVGDPISGSATDCRGYYALAADGKPSGTELYTYVREKSEEDEPALIVFSYYNNNNVIIKRREEYTYIIEWQGLLNKDEHHFHQFNFDAEILVTSDYPVSVLVMGKRFYDDPAAYCIPSTSGSFYGNEFYTYSSGGDLFFFSYNDGTHIDLYDTIMGQIKGSWDLDKYEKGSYGIPWTDLEFYYTILASKPITACRRFSVLDNLGMHYIADKSGTLIGTEFVFDATPPIEIIAYEDGTTVEHHRSPGNIDTYTLNAYQHVTITSNTSGRIISNKAISVVSIGTTGATFVPIPFEELETAPGPPAVFAVHHYPPQPTVFDSIVNVKWATDEPCTSCITYRRNGGFWSWPQCEPTFKTQHVMAIDISGFSGNDKIDYYVWSTDKDNYTTINNNKGKFYSFTITPNIPQLSVGRLSVYLNPEGDAYTVNLEVENTGIAKAEKIEIRERLTGLLSPTDNCTIIPVNDYQYEVRIPVPDIPPGGRGYVSYELVPILYGTYATYGIGLDAVSTISYESPAGHQYQDSFSYPATLDSQEALGVIKQKDYVIATSVNRLIKEFKTEDAGRVLHEAAKFSLARDGVVACLDISYGQCVQCQIEKLIDTNWNGRLNPMGWAEGWEYLLFIGRSEIVPTLWHIFEVPFEDDRKAMFADNVYADVKEGDDYKPELIVGRLPGRSADKLIEQMQNSLSPIDSNKVVLISGTGDGQDEFVKNINEVVDLLDYPQKFVTHWKDLATKTDRLDAFKADAPSTDLVVYRDHGSVDCWDGTVCTGHMKDVDFMGKHPMVWSIACWTGNVYKYCLADAFLEEADASVFIGSSDLSPRTPNNKFAKLLAIYHNHPWYGRSMGETFKNAKWKVIKDNIHWYTTVWTDARYKQLVNEYNLFGDPKRGLPPKSATSTQKIQTVEIEPEYDIPPDHIRIEIPDFEVETVDRVDYVTLPEPHGATFEEHNEPIVPTYIHTEYIDAGFKIQDVVLTGRSEPETTSGLHLPIASFAEDDAQVPGSSEGGSGFFPNKEHIFSWKVFEEIDGNQVLVITIFPFYYNKETTDIEFYRRYAFDIHYVESSVAITDITIIQDETPPGEPVTATVHINNGSGQVLYVYLRTEILNNLYQVVDVVPSIDVTLEPGDTAVPVIWNTSGRTPGYYYFKETVITEKGSLLDTEAKKFRLGSYRAISVGLETGPSPEEGFEIGMPVGIVASFENICAYPLTGVATIRILHETTSETVHEFVQEIELAPDQPQHVNTVWETIGMQEGSYRISAFLAYDGKTTEPLSVDISTRQDIGITIQTEKDIYDLGEKVVAWVSFSDPSGNPLSDVSFSSWVRGPVDSGIAFPLDFTYYPILNFHVGWFLLLQSFPEGEYEILVTAEKPGYRPTLEIKSIFVGVVVHPCPGDFDCDRDVDGSDLAVFAAGETGISLEEFAADFGRTDCPPCP